MTVATYRERVAEVPETDAHHRGAARPARHQHRQLRARAHRADTRSPGTPRTAAGRACPRDALDEDDAQSGRFIWLFPNTAVNILPNHSFVMITRPQGPDRTVESTFILSHPGSVDTPGSGEALDQLSKFWNLVNVQDIEIVEMVQQGIRARPTGRRMCYRFEEPLHRYRT